jgi:hypothetical protein
MQLYAVFGSNLGANAQGEPWGWWLAENEAIEAPKQPL